MASFNFLEMFSWNLYVSQYYSPDDPLLVCVFKPGSLESVAIDIPPTNDILTQIFKPMLASNPWNFLEEEGCPRFIASGTEMSYEDGNPVTISQNYYIAKIIPVGFQPIFATVEPWPDKFRWESFVITYAIQDSSPYPVPENRQESPLVIEGDDYLLYQPLPVTWDGIPSTSAQILHDGDLFLDPSSTPSYPYLGEVWVRNGFESLLSDLPFDFFDAYNLSWEYTDLPWGQPHTPSHYLFEADLQAHFNEELTGTDRWIRGGTAQERSDERILLENTLIDPFPEEFRDYHIGCMDRPFFYFMHAELAYGELTFNIHNRINQQPLTFPDRWRAWYQALWYGEETEEETALYIRPMFPVEFAASPLIAPTILQAFSTFIPLTLGPFAKLTSLFPDRED